MNQPTISTLTSKENSLDSSTRKKYSVILADPPWNIEQKGKHGAAGHYHLMTLAEIKAMGSTIKQISADDAHLWLWITNAALPYAKEVCESWGFTYRSILTWCKPRLGLGVYLRNSTEQIILATKGKAPVGFRAQPTWLFAPLQDHSHKPEEIYAIIERVSGHLGQNKLELFARRKVGGWDVWGDEVQSDTSLRDFGYSVPSDEDESSNKNLKPNNVSQSNSTKG